MSVKYRELDFKSDEEREKGIRYVVENAEVSMPKTRVVRIGKTAYRVSLHVLKGQYYFVHEPKEEFLLPRLWLVTIPGFSLCEVPISREMVPCRKRVTGVFVDDSELIYVCDYHGSGFKVFRGVLDRQLKPVPQALCVRYCPQAIKTGSRLVIVKKLLDAIKEKRNLVPVQVTGEVTEEIKERIMEFLEEVPVYECRAFLPYMSDKEEIKRRRPYRGMLFLCVEDYWWRRYLRRREVE